MNIEVTNYIEGAADGHREILVELRKLILTTVPNANEQFKWGRPVYATEKDFCYLKTTKKQLTLGFLEFDKISTNRHLLEGTGKSMRHIKLSSFNEIEAMEIEKMIQETIK